MKLLVINGPNMNILGVREKDIYGTKTYDDLIEFVKGICNDKGIICECYQSNHEGGIVDAIQQAYGRFDGIVINPAAYTHTSVAILDALKAVCIPTVEVHLSDIERREESFRRFSYISLYSLKTIAGLGFEGYRQAVNYLEWYINKKRIAQGEIE